MGSKYTGIMSLVYRQPGLRKFFKGRGQPKTAWFVKATICIKVRQYSKNYKISTRQAFLKLCKLSSHDRKTGFYMLMDYHFKNKRSPNYWKDRMINNPDTQINFYKNHVKKWFPRLK